MSDSTNDAVIAELKEKLGDKIAGASVKGGFPMLEVQRDNIHEVCTAIKNDFNYIYLIDIVGTDRFTSEDRFEVIYNIVNLKNQRRIFVKTTCEEEEPLVDTVSDIWPAANWYEREVYDMFGVRFNNHPDMRRIYMPEDFQYYPLRKEFPLLGIPGSIDLPNSTPDID